MAQKLRDGTESKMSIVNLLESLFNTRKESGRTGDSQSHQTRWCNATAEPVTGFAATVHGSL